MNLTNIQNQFGAHAEKYVQSSCFATGESLDKMIELLQEPEINRALDVATGGGHTAIRLRSISDHVVAGDDHRLSNLQATCGPCHIKKTNYENKVRRTKRMALKKRPTDSHPGIQ